MLEKKLWCAFLCLLTFNLSLPYGWWMAAAQAAPVTPVIHLVQKSSLATTSGDGTLSSDDAFSELNHVWSTLFAEQFSYENWRLPLLTSIHDGVAVGESPSGALFDIQAASLINVSQDVLSELEPDQAAQFPCDDFAQSFIGEIHIGHTSMAVTGLILKEDFCQQTTLLIMSSINDEEFELMYGEDVPDVEDGPNISISMKCPVSDCDLLNDCYEDCQLELDAQIQERLNRYKAAAQHAKDTWERKIARCIEDMENACNNANTILQNAIKAANQAYASEHQAALEVFENAHAALVAMTFGAIFICGWWNPICLGITLATYAITHEILRNGYKKAVKRAERTRLAAINSAQMAFNQAETFAIDAALICANRADEDFQAEMCSLFCLYIFPILDDLREYADCLDHCYDQHAEECTFVIGVEFDALICRPAPPEAQPAFQWLNPIPGCNCN